MMLSDVRQIIWLQTGFLGDIILTTAAFHFVRQHFPEWKQSLITTPLGALALKDHPDLDAIHTFDKRGKTLLGEARRLRRVLGSSRSEAVILQCHRSARSSLLARLLGVPTITYTESKLAWLAKAQVPRVAVLHEVQRILILLEALGVSREAYADALPILPEATQVDLRKKVELFAAGRPLVGLAPGSVWGTKRWPAERYGELGQRLLEASPAVLIILGSKDETLAAQDVLARIPGPLQSRVLNLTGSTSLDELRALYPMLQLLVSNDSSPLHYASAFRVPSLAIFGATVPGLGFGPLAPRSQIAEISLPCRPCSDHGPQVCPLGHFRCMLDQSVERVFHVILDNFAADLGLQK